MDDKYVSMTDIPDVTLNNIGEAVGTNGNTVLTLGIHLGLKKPVIDVFIDSNNRTASPLGTKNMLFKWRENAEHNEQIDELREGLIESELLRIAEKYLPKRDQSQEITCRKCFTIIANTSNVIDTKKSSIAINTMVTKVMGKNCQAQLMDGVDFITNALIDRYDVITLTTADVKLSDEVIPRPGGFKDYQGMRYAWCKECSKQVGWYFVPQDNTSSEPFYGLFLQALIRDLYDSDRVPTFKQGHMSDRRRAKILIAKTRGNYRSA